ncbi:peptidoglycan-binding protein [Jiangella muralis]|uniref:peptidoglycan-binding protein n=1 Tax=Jiangella muralis TaxID=702383 RepID=UPI00069DC97D|nr:peptidoglycan-binding protein [Jiangella muralis]
MSGTPPRRRRRRTVLWVAVTVVVAGATTAAVAVTREDDAEATAETETPSTTPVTVRDLVERSRADGSLDYSSGRQLKAGRTGVLTWLPAEGDVIGRGGAVARIDDVPVPLLFGELPFYRELRIGVDDGPDVLQLEQNLEALGVTPDEMEIDDHFTRATARALKELQEDWGMEETGVLLPGDVAVASGEIRVGAQSPDEGGADDADGPAGAAVGDTVAADTPLLTTTSTQLQVEAEVSIGDADIAGVGTAAVVTLPDGSTVDASVVSTGTPEKDDEDKLVVPIVLALGDAAVAAPPGSPVSVELVAQTAADALAVPVTALVALAEGGFAVQVVTAGADGEQVELVPVEPGMYADGFVQVTGDGIGEGTEVVVPE